jgi:hypothetical protein
MNELVPFDQLKEMALVMGKTGMFGKSPDQLMSLMLIAQAEGLHPAIAAQEYDIIQGRPAINSRAALSRFQAEGGTVQWVSRTDEEAVVVVSHPKGGQLQVTWNLERAKKAGLIEKDNWKHYPGQMLAARAVAEGIRAVYPACLSRMYTKEELEDGDTPPFAPIPVQPAERTVEGETVVEETPKNEKAEKDAVLRTTIKAEVSSLVDILGTKIDGEAYFSDEEKVEAKKRIASASQGTDLELKRELISKVVEEYEAELKTRQGHTPLAEAVRDALAAKNNPIQEELY